jgi:hypothetical protein
MKAIAIVSNWLIALLFAGSIDTEASPLWASMLAVLWFAAASLLLRFAHRRGWLNRLNRFLNEL